MRRAPRAGSLLVAAVAAWWVAGCGLDAAEDAWCAEHPAAVEAAVPDDLRDEVEYRDYTWKDACRRAYQVR